MSKRPNCLASIAVILCAVRPFGEVHADVPVTVNVDTTQTIGTIPAAGLALHTSVYANIFDEPTLPSMIAASGVQTLRFPGGSYSDLYHWSNHTGSAGAYIAQGSDFGNFVRVMDASNTRGMVTINYGSSHQGTMGGQPREAAAWVAYANGAVGNTHVIGTDQESNNWYDVDYWARLRSSTPAEYQTWATSQGRYNAAHQLLAIDRDDPVGIRYWEIGNEVGGNGYWGPQWEYDLHAPYNNGNSNDNTGRVGNPLLSPTAYATHFIDFAQAMKAVDPTIKIGAGLEAPPTNSGNQDILTTAGDQIDFGIIHWYPATPLPEPTGSGNGSLAVAVQSVKDGFAQFTSKQPGDYELHITEFGYSAPSPTPVTVTRRTQNALFVADAYMTAFALGVKSAHFLEMSTSHYVDDGPLAKGEVYHAYTMISPLAQEGNEIVQTQSSLTSLRIHAVRRPDGSIVILLINTAEFDASTATVQITLSGIEAGASATRYEYGWDNLAADVGPTQTTLALPGSTFTISVPDVSIVTVIIPATAMPEPAALGILNLGGLSLLTRRR